MKNLTSLTKKDLLHLAEVYNIVVTSKITKQQLIDLISPKHSTKKIETTSKKYKHLVQDRKIYFDNTITILPQSNESVLIIWNADPSGDEQIKAWKISNDLGLDILLPSYARSVFINITVLEKLDFYLYKIYQNDTKKLFKKYDNPQISIYTSHHQSDSNTQDQLIEEHLASVAFSRLSSSSNNFSRLSSSSNNFRT